jgi:selenocysteine-specific elongation factor
MTAIQRKNIMLGTAGHVDHGKTAVVKILTGCNTDSPAQERKRGLTIDLGFAPCKMADEVMPRVKRGHSTFPLRT